MRTKFTISLVCALMLCAATAYAKKQIFVRQYTYRAGDDDSKSSSRDRASTELKKELLREVGEVITAQSRNINGEYSENIESIAAGEIKKMIITDEKWTGESYWMQAEVTIDIDKTIRLLEELQQDKKKEQELQEERRRREQAEEQLKIAQQEAERYRQAADANKDDAAASRRYKESQRNYRQAVKETSKAQDLNVKTFVYNYDFNYSLAGAFGGSIGARRISSTFGYYLRFKIRTGLDSIISGGVPDLYSLDKNERKIERIGATFGTYARVQSWLYLYGGLGYGSYQVGYSTGKHYTETSTTSDGKTRTSDKTIYYVFEDDKREGLEAELGVMLKLKKVTFSVGYVTILSGKPMFGDILLGVGVEF